MKPHYFDQAKADDDDMQLRMCINQGYVPPTCLLGGVIVWSLMIKGEDPCAGCNCDRAKCYGRPGCDL